MRPSLERLFGKSREFPLEITLSSGDKHIIPHPDYALVHPKTHDLILFPEDGDYFSIAINPDQIVSIRPLREAKSA
jgi:hypothetical protein